MKKGLFCLILVLLLHLSSSAQLAKVQAGFIYSFTRYLTWDENSMGDAFVIGILGNTSTTEALRMLEGNRTIQNRQVEIKTYETIGDIGKCLILYIPKERRNSLEVVLAKIGNNPTLIICEEEGMAAKGAGINFLMVSGRVNFEINPAAIKRQGISIQPQLVALAYRVY
ncbi:MAG TPA: YfiR family protein [Williamwhitmania sp.]|nr:YfiR family protein [Williamwhitmania sp.]